MISIIIYKIRLLFIKSKLNKQLGKQTKSHLTDAFLMAMNLSDNDEDDEYLDEPDEGAYKPRKGESLESLLNNREDTFSTTLLKLIDESGMKDSVIYKRACVDRRLFSKIRSNKEYAPSKKTVIAFCLALKLPLDKANFLLEKAGYTLSHSSRFDLIIMYLIMNKKYSVPFANLCLSEYGEDTL